MLGDFNFDLAYVIQGNTKTVFIYFHNDLTGIVNKHIPMKTTPFHKLKIERCEILRKKSNCTIHTFPTNRRKIGKPLGIKETVTKIKRQIESVNQYIIERCGSGPKRKDLWPTIKPFLTNKCTNDRKNIILCENDCLVSDQTQVIPSTTFVNVEKNIGADCVDVNSKYPSIVKLICAKNTDKSHVESYSFHPVDINFVSKGINNLGLKKATCIDGISAEIVKLSHEQI